MRTRVFGNTLRLPLAPAASRTADTEAAIPSAVVATFAFMNRMVS
jgi:hypothetical protein